ncbi:hypothetical protein JCM16358_19330 [Halanaerocella petrolearia]
MINEKETKQIISNYSEKYCELKGLYKKWKLDKSVDNEEFNIDSLLNIYIEPTNACNLKCYFCARENMERDIKFLDFESFKRIIDPLPEGSYITLTGNGEPLLNEEIYDMIEYAANNDCFVSLITNGTVLTEVNAKKLIQSGISRVQFSFDSINRKVYEDIRVGADYEDTLFKILRFIYLAKKKYNNDIFISISSVQTEKVKEFAEESKEFWTSMPIDNYYESPLMSLQTDSNAYDEIDFKKENWRICAAPWLVTKIDSDGKVTGCHHDYSAKYIIGNVNDNDILEIINSESAIKLRESLFKGDKPFFEKIGYNCHRCNVWREGGGYNFKEFLSDTYPIRMKLVLDEINLEKDYSFKFLEEKMSELKEEKI